MNTPTKRYHPSLIFAIGALLAALPATYAEETPAPAGETRREKMEKGGERMADALGLSDDQRAKFKVINEQEKTELKTLRSDPTLSDEDRRAKAGELHKKYRDQRDALLTPEQKAKADKMHERMEKRRGDRHEKDGNKSAN